MTDHARLSPSKRHRWSLCPGSIREEDKYPNLPNISAIDGTHSHTLLEHCISNKIDALSMIGQWLNDDDGTFQIDEARAKRVQIAINYVNARVEKLKFSLVNDNYIMTEEKVDPVFLTKRSDLSGTVDIQIAANDVLEIIDYKDGFVSVKAENNKQLLQYAVGAISQSYPQTFNKIRLTIVQPKNEINGISSITSWDIDINRLFEEVGLLVEEASKTDDPEAPLIPGEVQCKYCKHKGACPALANDSMNKIGIMIKSTEQKPFDMIQQSADKEPTTMSAEQIKEIIEAAPLVRQLLESVEEEALRRLKSGQSISGLKLVHGRGSRSWSLDEDEISSKLIKMGIPKGSLYETKLISPAKAEKISWEKRDGTKKQLSERQLRIMNTEYISKSQGKLIVVSESDERGSVLFNAESLFNPIEDIPPWMK